MFVVDALIGNKDRHLGNWGLLEKNGELRFAPVYDCGSSLSALLNDIKMQNIMSDPTIFKSQEFNLASVYSINGKRIFYHEIFKKSPDDLIKAIKRIIPKINIDKIHDIIDSTETLSAIRKGYIKKAVSLRYEQMLLPALKRILRQEKDASNSKPSLMEKIDAGIIKAAHPPRDERDLPPVSKRVCVAKLQSGQCKR